MRPLTVVGNWKMQGDKLSIRCLLDDLVDHIPCADHFKCVVLPSFMFIPDVANRLNFSSLQWGAQNLSHHSQGAYTGEISGSMLAEFGCQYVLVGHSERRQYHHETNELVAQKFLMAQQCGLIPILCVGETLVEYETHQTLAVLTQQIEAVLSLLGEEMQAFANAVIAYEPIWAIGTGKTATPEYAEQIHAHIRACIEARNPTVARQVSVIYGGSVKADNARSLLVMPNIDGVLVGGASLHAQEFLTICQQAMGNQ